MNVVLTREQGRNDPLRQWLPPEWQVHEVPLTRTRFFDEQQFDDDLRASQSYGRFHAMVVTSARSARYAARALRALAPHACVLSVGAATSSALESVGVKVRVQSSGAAIELARQIDRGPVLVLGAVVMRGELTDELTARSVEVTIVPCYETELCTLDGAAKETLGRADVVVIGAPSAWSVAAPHVGASAWVVVPGATTAHEVRTTHGRIVEGWGPSLRQRLESL